MKLSRAELLFLRNATVGSSLSFCIFIKDSVSMPRLNIENKFYNVKCIQMLSEIVFKNGDVLYNKEEDVSLIKDIYETESELPLNNIYWLRNCTENDLVITDNNNTVFKNREELFRHVFQTLLIEHDAKCLSVIYKLKGLFYNCLVFRDLTVIHDFRYIDNNIKKTNVYVNDFNYMFNLKGNIEFIGFSPNYETPTKQAYFNQLGRLRSANSVIKVYD